VLVPNWARAVHDDGDVVVVAILAVDGGKGTDMEAAEVGHDSGEARRDALLGEELLESGEKFVDFIGGLEPADVVSWATEPEDSASFCWARACFVQRSEAADETARRH
jgi:hypothetical protein